MRFATYTDAVAFLTSDFRMPRSKARDLVGLARNGRTPNVPDTELRVFRDSDGCFGIAPDAF